MAKVFLHIHDEGESNWENLYYDFGRVPTESEFLATSNDSEWYKVELVVHTPFSAELEAEVFAVKVSQREVKRDKLNTDFMPTASQIENPFK
ncbi:hypothetical protein ACJA3J_05725 [Halobacillus sp. SY10]|uniref:hypothetical protein n=1 Tax=Halobacillus sp. SY10 TaxID=3381356 RepID=UPI003879B820